MKFAAGLAVVGPAADSAVAGFAGIVDVVGVAAAAAAAAAAVTTTDQEYPLALIQFREEPMVPLKGSHRSSKGVRFYNQCLDIVPGASCKDPS